MSPTPRYRRLLYLLPVPRFFSQQDGVGGSVAHCLGVVAALARLGLEVTVIAGEAAPVLDGIPGVTTLVLPCASSGWRSRLAWQQGLVAAVAQEARWGHDLIYARYSTGFALQLPFLASRLGGRPLVLEVNSLGCQRHAWLRPLERRALGRADLIVAVTPVLADFIAQSMGPGVAGKVVVIPNGVDWRRFQSASPLELGAGPGPHLGYAGSFKPDYGLEGLVEALGPVRRQVPGAILHLVGQGPLRGYLAQGAARQEGLVLHEPLPIDQVPAFLKAMDLLLYCTSARYGFQSPIKLYEYMAAGRPIVAARTDETAALLAPDRGRLFAVGEVPDLTRAVLETLADPVAARAMARRAAAEVQAHHSWEERVGRILAALEERVGPA